MSPVGVLVTLPPYAPFAAEVAAHPMVAGLRLNTVMPLREPPSAVLERLRALGKPLWVDLKGRQLRVVGYWVPPFTEVRVSHPVEVPCPADAYFSDGREHVRVVAVDGDRLILEDGPRRVVGPGESVNIVHPRLRVRGTLTEGDRAWLAAMRETGERRVMLSFVERPEDAAEVRGLLPDVELVQKIESERGLLHARATGAAHGRLMAARGDLYVELRPHQVVRALRALIAADPDAIAASRVLGSLARSPVPDCADISDVALLLALGYRTLMLGDEVCLRRDAVIGALNLLAAIVESEAADGALSGVRSAAPSAPLSAPLSPPPSRRPA